MPAPEASDQRIELRVNGKARSVEVAPETPLLYVLRNDLGLKGSRFGCGTGLCGACMVLLDGRAVTSCDLPVEMAADRRVTTVEGLADDGTLDAVQEAIIEERAGQCGYCLSGIVVSATALLEHEPAPTLERIEAALEPHVCRCGAHPRILRAVRAAAERMAP